MSLYYCLKKKKKKKTLVTKGEKEATEIKEDVCCICFQFFTLIQIKVYYQF